MTTILATTNRKLIFKNINLKAGNQSQIEVSQNFAKSITYLFSTASDVVICSSL